MTVEVFTVVNIYTTQHQNPQDGAYTLSITEWNSVAKPTRMNEIFSGKQSHQDVKENLDILRQLSAQENFIEFCCRESFKTYIN